MTALSYKQARLTSSVGVHLSLHTGGGLFHKPNAFSSVKVLNLGMHGPLSGWNPFQQVTVVKDHILSYGIY